jgi:hypothetical protein
MRLIFKKPKKRDILIFDRAGLEVFKLFFFDYQFEVLDRRKESINIYIIIITILNEGFKNFKLNYFKNYLRVVNPKIVLTFIDNNFSFFLLKKLFPSAKYICIQNGMRDKNYFNDLKKFKKNNQDMETDFYFSFGKKIEIIISPIIKSIYYNIGSIKNNYYSLDNKAKKHNLKKSITFISQFKEKFRHSEKVIIKFLSEFCVKKKIPLNILGKINSTNIDKFYKNLDFNLNCNFYPKESMQKTYEIINNSNMVVYADSTLGYEALSKGIKVVSFPFGSLDFKKKNSSYIQEVVFGYPFKYPNIGFFWLNFKNNDKMNLILERVYNCPIYRWKKKYIHYKKNIMQYDKNNTKFKMVIKDILKDFKFRNNS